VEGDAPIDSELLLMTDFINLKIKSAQYFRCVYRDMMCVRVFIEMSAHTYINIYIYTVSNKTTVTLFLPFCSTGKH
jgi:hypothetical protein